MAVYFRSQNSDLTEFRTLPSWGDSRRLTTWHSSTLQQPRPISLCALCSGGRVLCLDSFRSAVPFWGQYLKIECFVPKTGLRLKREIGMVTGGRSFHSSCYLQVVLCLTAVPAIGIRGNRPHRAKYKTPNRLTRGDLADRCTIEV